MKPNGIKYRPGREAQMWAAEHPASYRELLSTAKGLIAAGHSKTEVIATLPEMRVEWGCLTTSGVRALLEHEYVAGTQIRFSLTAEQMKMCSELRITGRELCIKLLEWYRKEVWKNGGTTDVTQKGAAI